jgi:hypothetical protein
MRNFNAELRDKDVRQDFHQVLEQYLQTRFGPSDSEPRSELPVTLSRVREFVSSVKADRFDVAVSKALAPRPVPRTATELVSDLANTFCHDFTGLESDLLKKSIQEALLFTVGVDGTVSVRQFGNTFRDFLRQRGTKGLIRLVLGLHMFNTVWFEFLESDAVQFRSEETLGRLSTVLEQECFTKAEAAIQMFAQDDDTPEA